MSCWSKRKSWNHWIVRGILIMFFIAGSFFDSPKSWTHTHGYESKFGTPIFEMVNTPKILWLPSSNQTWQWNDESHQSVRLFFFRGKFSASYVWWPKVIPYINHIFLKKSPWITISSPLAHYEYYYDKSWTKITINHYNIPITPINPINALLISALWNHHHPRVNQRN